MKKYERETLKILRQLGANNSYLGFGYVVYGIQLSIQNPELITYISKGLYSEIALPFHTTIGCVERDIYTVIDIIWKNGDHELLCRIFGRNLSSKPRNAAFIEAFSAICNCSNNIIFSTTPKYIYLIIQQRIPPPQIF